MTNRLTALWQYRAFITASVRREFQVKYQNSMLGALWTVLNPLAMIVIYTVIFSQVMKAKLPETDSIYAYSVYLCAGIIAWGLFSEVIGRCQTLFIDNANVLKKLSFPRLTLPIIVVLSALLNFAIITGLFLAFLVLSGQWIGWSILLAIPVLLIQLLFSFGLGMSLGILNVFFRDIGYLFNIVIQFWFWLTPIVYPATILPDFIKPLILTWNPMAPIISAYQTIFVYGKQPDWHSLLIPSLVGLSMLIIGFYLYQKHAHEIVDEL